jgi:hypothetical protein
MTLTNEEIRLLEIHIKREFRDVMPRRYWIFPTIPTIYTLSNSLCIEMPASGSIAYKMKLDLLKKELNKNFVMDILYDNNIVFILKKKR